MKTSRYLDPPAPRNAFVAARVTARDRELVELAARAAGVSLSTYVAEAATRAARRDLLGESAVSST